MPSIKTYHILGAVYLLLAGCEAPLPTAGTPCSGIADCAAAAEPLACAEGACKRLECEVLAQCPSGAACVSGLCRVPQCAADTDCKDSAAQCYLGECRLDLCRSREDCEGGTICAGAPPRCVAPPAVCASDTECPSGQSCDVTRGRCDRPCRLDGECAPVGLCRAGFCSARCEDDEGCVSGEVCADGVCQAATDCSQAAPCAGNTPVRDPISCECRQCLADEDCGRQQVCEAGSCRTCLQRVEEDAVCRAQGLIFEDGCCVECVDDVDCDTARGERCARGICQGAAQGSCVEDSDCPDGTICDGLRCAASATLTPCALQGDCTAGEACYPDARCRREATVCQGGAGCPAGSRCVAEPGDTLGACIGCNSSCGQAGCPAETRCALPSGAAEGACVAAALCR